MTAAAPGYGPPWVPPQARVTVVSARLWPGAGRPLRLATAALAMAAGLLAAVVLPTAAPGVGVALVGLLVTAAVAVQGIVTRTAGELGLGVVALALLAVVVFRDAAWLVTLCLLGGFGMASLALSRARSWTAVLATTAVLGAAAVRALPWAGRALAPLRLATNATRLFSIARGAAITAVVGVVFGSLFAGADPAFGHVLAAVTPQLNLGGLPARAVVFGGVAGLSLGAAYVCVAPPRWDAVTVPPGRPARLVEWAAPLLVLIAMFVLFVSLQFAALFGGRDFVARTAHLTWAQYARHGFWQLLAVTALSLAVVAIAARKAPRSTGAERAAARGLLATLCGLTLIVVASALERMHLYVDAFGMTRARLFAGSAELWLGAVVVLVVVAGARWSVSWLPRAVALSAAAGLLLLAAANADAIVARTDVQRYERTGRIDVPYLSGLSADAVPALDRLPEPLRSCALAGIAARLEQSRTGWAGANLARSRARTLLSGPKRPVACASRPDFQTSG